MLGSEEASLFQFFFPLSSLLVFYLPALFLSENVGINFLLEYENYKIAFLMHLKIGFIGLSK